ncbi:MAG: tRNA (adenosine(37)-N6)-threonylcarbamoyltransferase complex dimerization subunit type 1 TsaB [Myxococcales bacterium]|nr:tRNA (adenosine(37)-N6)-threonylcarbamoyltransferase complex dimerization subunit type 1 TsaB [Myxococcales bacterium]
MMLALGLDTATNTASVAVVDMASGDVRAEAVTEVAAHSTNLLALIADALAQASVSLAEIQAFVAGAGPGSFTGLRIGLATVKGLAYVHRRPLWLTSSLAATLPRAGAMLGGHDTAVVVLDARRAEVYVGWFARVGDGWQPLRDESVTSAAALTDQLVAFGRPVTLVGDGALLYRDALTPALAVGHVIDSRFVTPSAAAAIAAIARLEHGARVDALFAGAPTYIRLAEAQVKFPHGLVPVAPPPSPVES